MAEGGDIPDESFNPFDTSADLGDHDDDNTLYMSSLANTSTTHPIDPYEEDETSFGGINEKQPLLDARMKDQDDAEKEIKNYYPRADTSKFITFFKDIGDGIKTIVVNLRRGNPSDYVLLDGELQSLKTKSKKLPDQLKNALGPRAEEVVEANDVEIAKIKESQNKKKEEIKFLRNKPLNIPEDSSRIETLDREIAEDDNEIANRESETERNTGTNVITGSCEGHLQKVWFYSICSCECCRCGHWCYISNLSKGLTKLGKGVGNGLKTIGKKLGEILPGMIGAIVSFLFKTAGEVIGFLGKNAWLLIVAVVLYFVEQFKKKRR